MLTDEARFFLSLVTIIVLGFAITMLALTHRLDEIDDRLDEIVELVADEGSDQ